jgi:L-ribulose-5-phosphate 3-epimerase
MNRRNFLAAAGAAVPALALPPGAGVPGARFRTGLVAYSYRDALTAKTMTYDDLVRLAFENGIDGIDMTVYWFPSTEDDFVLPLRRRAYKMGVAIYSLGVRARMCQPTAELREKELAELRKWIDVAQKMGAGHVRVFGGRAPQGATMDQAISWAAETLKRGAEYAGARGIILGLEDDGGITDYARETVEIVRRADSPWVGINLDTGNFRAPKVWEQIEMCLPYAVSSHVKTQTRLDDGTFVRADWDKIFALYARHGYKGYVGLEYEGREDAKVAVPRELKRLRELAQKYST